MEDLKEKCTCHEDCTCENDCQCDEANKCSEDCICSSQNECHCIDEKENKKEKKKEKKQKEIEHLNEQIKKLEDEKQELLTKIQYAQAELINYRKRKEEETTQRLKYANQEIISEMIVVLDNFERAIKLDDNNLSDELSKFLQGFKMMYASFVDILKRFGVEEIDCLHQKFNPNQMEALMIETDENYDDEEVLEVLLKGYKLKDRVLRPASVKVNKIEKKEGEDKHE